VIQNDKKGRVRLS